MLSTGRSMAGPCSPCVPILSPSLLLSCFPTCWRDSIRSVGCHVKVLQEGERERGRGGNDGNLDGCALSYRCRSVARSRVSGSPQAVEAHVERSHVGRRGTNVRHEDAVPDLAGRAAGIRICEIVILWERHSFLALRCTYGIAAKERLSNKRPSFVAFAYHNPVNFFTLALALSCPRRITTLTTSRTFHAFDRALVRHAARDCIQRRSFGLSRARTSEEKSGNEFQKPLDFIRRLLQPKTRSEESSNKAPFSSPPEQTQSPTVTTEDAKPHAELVANIKPYSYRPQPTEQWRFRHILPTNSRYGVGRPTLSEIAFKPHHRAALQPPQHELFENRRSFDFVGDKMRCWVQVLTTPTADTPGTTLLLHFDNKRYLVGSLAEGTQRASVQMGARLLKVSECFLTGRTEWMNTGGLIGMILSLADAGTSSRTSATEEAVKAANAKGKQLGILEDEEKMVELMEEYKSKVKSTVLRIFSPPNLNHTMATARRFVFRKGMPLDLHEIRNDRSPKEGEDEWAPYWADGNIKVWPMSISPSSESEAQSTRVSTSITPRKRAIDEVYDRQSSPNGVPTDDMTDSERDLLTVKAVVSEMFDSSWRLDTLYETPLSRVNLPASIFIRNPETRKVERYTGPLPGGKEPLADPDLPVLVRRPWPGALVQSLPETHPAKEAISYIIRNHMQRGKFRAEEAKKLGVEREMFSKLAAGESVQNSKGETVTPEMVLEPSKPGNGFAVVDVPDPSYIDNLLSRPEWTEPKVIDGVGGIVWICGNGVAEDIRVVAFMKRFSRMEHVVSSPEHCTNRIALDSSAASTLRLSKVDPDRYRVPVHDTSSLVVRESTPLENIHVAERGQVLQLEPSFKLLRNEVVPPLDLAAVEEEMSKEVLEEAELAQKTLQQLAAEEDSWTSSLPIQDAEITTLGTGSALPSKYRNVSATLVRVPGWGSLLLDCGENTLGQLKRTFPPEELKQVLQELRLIFISHMHADHHLGTVGVIKAWYEEVHAGKPIDLPGPEKDVSSLLASDQKRLAVISEPAMLEWLAEYAAVEDYGFSRIAPINISPARPFPPTWNTSKLNWFIPPTELSNLPSSTARMQRLERNIVPASLLGLDDIQAVLVTHCHGARAVSITFPSGFKVSYSGDCRPSKNFSRIGKGSTVCIHEATFDDELLGDAKAKNHSTTSEALGVAQDMGAKACVLTHFSQRYQKIPVLEKKNTNGDVESAIEPEEPHQDVEMDEDAEISANPTDAMAGPLEDLAPTLPAQEDATAPAEHTVPDDNGKQYDLPPRRSAKNAPDDDQRSSTKRVFRSASASKPEAVKFKLASDMKVCVAFDYMRVKVGDIGKLEKFTPALLKLFAEEDKKGEVDDGGGGADRAAASGKGKGKKNRTAKKEKGKQKV